MARPNEHRKRNIPSKDRTYRANWLRNLKADGLQPEIRVVEYTSEDDIDAAEEFWIQNFRSMGCPLTNHKSGGARGRADDITKRRISKSMQGRKLPPEQCQNISASKQGSKNPMYGRKASQTTRDKMADSKRGEKNHRYGMTVPGGEEYRFKPGHKGKRPAPRYGEDHPMFGKHHTEESRRLMSESKKGQVPWNKGTAPVRLTPVRALRCSSCGEIGHNKRTCVTRETEQ